MKKSVRIFLIVVGVLCMLVVLATLIAAPIAKRYINRHGEELVGRRIQLDELRLNVYTGHVALRHAALYEADGTTPFVSFDTLDVRLKLSRLLHSELFVKELTLSGLDVKVEQRDTVFNFSSMLEYLSRNDTTPPDTTPSEWLFTFHNVAMRHGQIHYADLGRDSRWEFNDLNLRVPDFSMGGDKASDAGLTLQLGDGGRLEAEMHYDVRDNSFEASFDLNQFNISQLLPYLTDQVRLSQLDGLLALRMAVKGNLSHIMELQLNAHLSLDRLLVADSREELASCRHLAVDLDEANLGTNQYRIGNIVVDGLESHYDLRDEGSTFSSLMVPAQPSATATAQKEQTAATPVDLRIAHFELFDSRFTFNDHTLPDPFSFAVKNMHLTADDVTLAGDNAVHLTADLPDGGRAVVHWRGNIDHWQRHQDLLLVISNLKLTLLSPYLVAYLGYPFTDGNLSFQSRNRIVNSKLDGKNHLDIYRVDVGKRRKDVDAQMRLPLKAALFILKDKEGKIDLELPVSGDVSSPEFSYMKLVWKTLGNLLVKVATSPLRALGDALGFNGENLEYMEISPDQFDFSSEQYFHIEQLARLMQHDTMLRVTFQQELPSDLEDGLLQRGDHRNQLLQHHLTEWGVTPARFDVTTVVADTVTQAAYRFISSFVEED